MGVASKPITTYQSLRKSASSMFVAIFEAMFQVTLKGIVRKPKLVKDYEHNAQAVIDALGTSILNMDLSHISGASIVKGDAAAIMNLVDIFVGISEVWLKRRFQNDALERTRMGELRMGEFAEQGVKAKKMKKMKKMKPPRKMKREGTEGTAVPKLKIPNSSSSSKSSSSSQARPRTAPSSSASARTGTELHKSLESLATDYPKMWASLSSRAAGAGGSGTLGGAEEEGGRKPSRAEFQAAKVMEEREAKQKLEYRRLLKDRLVEIRRKSAVEEKRQATRARGTRHASVVRGIRVREQEDCLNRARVSGRLRRKTAQETRMRRLHLSMLKSLRSSKREAAVADGARMVEMKREGGERAEALDAFFAERIEMVNRHIGAQESERDAQSR